MHAAFNFLLSSCFSPFNVPAVVHDRSIYIYTSFFHCIKVKEENNNN